MLYSRKFSGPINEAANILSELQLSLIHIFARRFDTTVARLAGINKLSDPDALRPGQRLTLGLCG